MGSSPTEGLCILCLHQNVDVMNIFDKFENATIASILKQHFWSQVGRNEELSQCICQGCWNNTRTFHIFYEEVELQQENYWNSVDAVDHNVCTDLIKQEPKETEMQFDLNLVKSEETLMESSAVIFKMHQDESIDSSDYISNEQIQTNISPLKDVDEEKDEKRTNSLVGNSKTKMEKLKKRYEYRVDNDYLDAQLRVYFNMKCDICGDPFETYRNARKHYSDVHKMKGYVICCRKKFRRRGGVLDHIYYHLNPNAFSCDKCSKTFASEGALSLHIANHEPMSTRAFKCDLCPKSFTRETLLNAHKDFVHCPVKCVQCDKSYPSKSKLTTHIKNAHKPKVSTVRVCDICGKDFANKYTLLTHMQERHSAVNTPEVPCDICGNWLKNQSILKSHMKRHQESVPAECSQCGKMVKSKFSLSKHINYVHGEKKHQCSICSKSFRKSLLLKEHMAVHTGQHLYECAYCTKTFKSSANMSSHRKKMHYAKWVVDFKKKRSLRCDDR